MRLKLLLVIGFLALMSAGCDLGPVGTPPPLTKAQVSAVADCQHAIKTSSATFYAFKLAKLGNCADKILALQLAFENGLMTQAQFDKAIAGVQKDCLSAYEKIGFASTTMVNIILNNCTPVESLIFDSSYDPLKFIALGDSNPLDLGPIESVEDIVRYACLGGEVLIDTVFWIDFPRSGTLLESVDLAISGDGVIVPEISLDPRCSSG